MTTELEKRAKEWTAQPNCGCPNYCRDEYWLCIEHQSPESAYIAGAKAERARILRELEEQLVLCMKQHDLPVSTIHVPVSKIHAIMKGEE